MSAPVMAAVAAGALVLGVPVILAANAVVTDARAASAADAAALAAADAALGLVQAPGDPCALANEIARRNGATVVSCDVDPRHGEARVAVAVRSGVFNASRSARAGPPQSAPPPPVPSRG